MKNQTYTETTKGNEARDMLNRIASAVAKRMGVGLEKLRLPSGAPDAKKREYVEARHLTMTIGKRLLPERVSLAWIGNEIGGRDHATVLHAIRTVDNLCQTDKGMKRIYDELFVNLEVNLISSKIEQWITAIPQL